MNRETGAPAKFAKLLEPGRIGSMKLKNRIVMPAMATNYASEDGFVTDRMVDYYAERARGGVGLVIVEVVDVQHPLGNTVKRQLAIDDDKFIPGLRRLARSVHRQGARVVIQLHHAGRKARTVFTHLQPVAPSPIPLAGYDMPRELSKGEIADLVARFAREALRAQQAGLDGVELHAGHQYLISSFLSAASNKRADEYGGPLANRARFLLEVIQAIRSTVGRDFPVWCRLSAREFELEGGITIEETCQVASMAEKAGVDAIHVSGWPTPAFRFPPMGEPPGTMIDFAAAIKRAVSVPIIAVGRITPELGEQALRERKADFIAFGRSLIADPYIGNKLTAGRPEDITPCIGCLHCHESMRGYGTEDGYMQCAVNPHVGRERTTRLRTATRAKKVLVVGGGPGGMMAAITAASRGHAVVLCERLGKLGGQLDLAVVPPHKDNLKPLAEHLVRQLQVLGVEVRLNAEVSRDYVSRLKPDAVVLASGAAPSVPEMSGASGGNVVTAQEVLSGSKAVGEKVVIIGGQLIACETAEYLASHGKRVTILGRRRPVGQQIRSAYGRRLMLQRLAQAGVNIEEHVEVAEIGSDGVRCRRDGRDVSFPADTVVLATGSAPTSGLAQELAGQIKQLYSVGDCVSPRGIAEAIEEGFMAGRSI